MISRKVTIDGVDYIWIGDMTWAIDTKGSLFTCARCADSGVVFKPKDHSRWHRLQTLRPGPEAAKAKADIYRSVAADIAAAELGDREAIGDDE